MKSNHVLAVLAGLTLVIQSVILYNQYRDRSDSGRDSRDGVHDAPQGTSFQLAGLPIAGDKLTRVVLAEFSDYQCPFCARHATTVGPQLDEKFVRTGRIRYAFVNNPLAIHSSARTLAAASICAGEQDRYWEMHDALFKEKPKTRDEIIAVAQDISVNGPAFMKCFEDDAKTTGRIDQDIQIAKKLNFAATPSFAIGVIDSEGKLLVKKLITGAMPLKEFEEAINAVLDSK